MELFGAEIFANILVIHRKKEKYLINSYLYIKIIV